MAKKDRPVLLGFPTENEKSWDVWCPFCQRMHHHGSGEGHVVAHCPPGESPFKEGGYYIKEYKPTKGSVA